MITAQELNDIYGDFLTSFKRPLNIDFTKGITEVPLDNSGAFMLTYPASSNITIEKTESGGVLVRYAFGYDHAETLRNYQDGLRFLSVVQNQMVTAISPWIDWSQDVPNLFQMPGKPNKFFIELQSYAGFEIRAYYNG